MKNVMVDCETLATTADAVILSIGAVRFDLETGQVDDDGFYLSISVDSNLALGRRISEDTRLWWFKQGAAAQQVFFEPKETLKQALIEFSDWLGTGDYCMWSNGADFDLPLLAHAFTQCGVEVPWKFWNNRCVRTYKNLPGAGSIRPAKQGVAHNAMADAVSQVELVSAIHKALFQKTKAKA